MHRSSAGPSVLGLFPRFGSEYRGGIQASASVAWQAIEQRSRAKLLLYSRHDEHNGNGSSNDSRLRAVMSALNRGRNPDLVLIWQIGLLKLLPFLRLRSARVVLYLHGIEAWREADWLTRHAATKVNLFLSNSEYTWNRFIQHNPQFAQSRHLTVPLGIAEPFEGSIEQPANPVALMLSRLSRAEDYKGHREVIKAWPLVLQKQPQAKLWIAGAGDLKNDLQEMVAQNRLQDSVRLFGAVSDEKKQRLLEQSSCLLMPSRGEGFGLVYLEAMRIGRPCLVSSEDAGREVVNPPTCGLAVDLVNRDQIASAITRLLDRSAEWLEWSRNARHRYEENFTARHFQERLLDVLFDPNPCNVSI